jgi:hypothetical protein
VGPPMPFLRGALAAPGLTLDDPPLCLPATDGPDSTGRGRPTCLDQHLGEVSAIKLGAAEIWEAEERSAPWM